MFMSIAKLSSCERSPDCAGPAANSDAVKVRYRMRYSASPRHARFRSLVASVPRRSHSFSAHRTAASNRRDSSAEMES